MSILNYVPPEWVPALKRLWKAAFGDDDAFLDRFFSTAFAPERCRCIVEAGEVRAALYWFDASCSDQKFAYLYAIATDPAHRNRGLCRQLVENTKEALKARGYAGLLLVPQEEALSQLYERMGFTPCTTVSEFWCAPELPAAAIHKIDAAAYTRSRQLLLPRDSVVQEGENIAFLESQATFYAGPGFLAAVTMDGENLHCFELLGDTAAAPQILTALGLPYGFFRCPGKGKPFAMLCPLTQTCPSPAYFGLAFD